MNKRRQARSAPRTVYGYRQPRLSAVQHIDHADTIGGIGPNATPEDLRVEIAKRIALLRDKGVIDLEALPPPEPAASS